jgi:hypothetical protein
MSARTEYLRQLARKCAAAADAAADPRKSENRQSVRELQANNEMQSNKRRNPTKLRSSPLLVYPITDSQRFPRQSTSLQPILD